MLLNLHVQNLALIDDIEVDFSKGLNIFTGETGAGKSMLIGSILIALGKKVEKSIIRNGKEFCLVELIFKLERQEQIDLITSLGLTIEEDDLITVSRKITQQRTTTRVCGETVTAAQLAEITGVLLDLYGQNEHQSLGKPAMQLQILDKYIGDEADKTLDEIKAALAKYKDAKTELEENQMDPIELAKKTDYLEYEINQISSASLKLGEDEALETDYSRMAHGEKIVGATGTALELLGGRGDNVMDMVGRATRELSQVSQYDDNICNLVDQLSQVEDMLTGAHRDIRDYADSLDYSQSAFEEVEKRLNLINELKSRYGGSIEMILESLETKQKELEKISDYEVYISELKQKCEKSKEFLDKACKKMTTLREKAGITFAKSMMEAMADLNFNDARFAVELDSDADRITTNGWDTVTFMVSTNPGEPMKALAQVASGGELSRMMLGLKTLMANSNVIDTLVFDEIDAGISGRTAAKVALALKKLAIDHQILCITHLPQIAAAADNHFIIEKSVEGGRTTTDIRALSEESSVEELARMLGTDVITEEAINNARALKGC